MQLNQLQDNPGARKGKIRVGRGVGSGKGKTGGRGYKGQKSRTGVRIHGFEGGQMPIHRRLPKRGFKSINRLSYTGVNLDSLQYAIDDKRIDASKPITVDELIAAGLVRSNAAAVKLLGSGELSAKVTIEVHKATKSAREAVKNAGGSLTELFAPAEAA
jgi:large subunit ribosomal protein L15